jgi:thiamine pyrophosphate-dependent acetolactate synthase large subunit-like protein
VKRLSGQFAEVAQAMGAYSERITAPQDIVPALTRGLAAVDSGRTTVLEFITADEGEYSKFAFQ